MNKKYLMFGLGMGLLLGLGTMDVQAEEMQDNIVNVQESTETSDTLEEQKLSVEWEGSGMISLKIIDETILEYAWDSNPLIIYMDIYKDGVLVDSPNFGSIRKSEGLEHRFDVSKSISETGTYTCQIHLAHYLSLGSNVAEAVSGEYYYVKPEQELSMPAGLEWEGVSSATVRWNAVENAPDPHMISYEIILYNDKDERQRQAYSYLGETEYTFENLQDGSYYFTLQAFSNDIETIAHSKVAKSAVNHYVSKNEFVWEEDEASGGIKILKYTKDAEEVIIPDIIDGKPVTVIGSNAFREKSLKKLSMGDNVKKIEFYAFINCTNLEQMELSNQLERIETGAFEKSGLKVLEIPGTIMCIEQWAFSNSNNLTSVVFQNGTNKIQLGYRAFGECSALERVEFGENRGINVCQTEVGMIMPEPVFQDCENLNTIVYKSSQPAKIRDLVKMDDKHKWYDKATGREVGAGEEITNCTVTTVLDNIEDNPEEPAKPDTPKAEFTDISSNAYYAAPVQWAVEKGITTGTSTTTFSPDKDCTRSQIVTFLWRAAGCPEPKSLENPFTDVKANAYYYKAVLWAVENGITSGTSATTFSPEMVCTRGQAVTFIYRYEGKPDMSAAANPFTDVAGGQYYYQPVLWAVKNEITNGTSAAVFSPQKNCTRGQIVTFLYRDAN